MITRLRLIVGHLRQIFFVYKQKSWWFRWFSGSVPL